MERAAILGGAVGVAFGFFLGFVVAPQFGRAEEAIAYGGFACIVAGIAVMIIGSLTSR